MAIRQACKGSPYCKCGEYGGSHSLARCPIPPQSCRGYCNNTIHSPCRKSTHNGFGGEGTTLLTHLDRYPIPKCGNEEDCVMWEEIQWVPCVIPANSSSQQQQPSDQLCDPRTLVPLGTSQNAQARLSEATETATFGPNGSDGSYFTTANQDFYVKSSRPNEAQIPTALSTARQSYPAVFRPVKGDNISSSSPDAYTSFDAAPAPTGEFRTVPGQVLDSDAAARRGGRFQRQSQVLAYQNFTRDLAPDLVLANHVSTSGGFQLQQSPMPQYQSYYSPNPQPSQYGLQGQPVLQHQVPPPSQSALQSSPTLQRRRPSKQSQLKRSPPPSMKRGYAVNRPPSSRQIQVTTATQYEETSPKISISTGFIQQRGYSPPFNLTTRTASRTNQANRSGVQSPRSRIPVPVGSKQKANYQPLPLPNQPTSRVGSNYSLRRPCMPTRSTDKIIVKKSPPPIPYKQRSNSPGQRQRPKINASTSTSSSRHKMLKSPTSSSRNLRNSKKRRKRPKSPAVSRTSLRSPSGSPEDAAKQNCDQFNSARQVRLLHKELEKQKEALLAQQQEQAQEQMVALKKELAVIAKKLEGIAKERSRRRRRPRRTSCCCAGDDANFGTFQGGCQQQQSKTPSLCPSCRVLIRGRQCPGGFPLLLALPSNKCQEQGSVGTPQNYRPQQFPGQGEQYPTPVLQPQQQQRQQLVPLIGSTTMQSTTPEVNYKKLY